jgi:AcrR family transcriptional regulator
LPLKREARRTSDGGSRTRNKILNAAEALFAVRGYYGVSIRDITKAAHVQLALANYHFGSKQALYGEVIRRRGPIHAAQMQRFLDQVTAAAKGRRPSLEAIIEAFCASIFERMMNGGAGWRRYIQLLARIADAPQKEGFVTPMNELFDPVIANYIAALRRVLPKMRPENLFAAFYFLQAGLVYTTSDTGGIDRQSSGALRSNDFRKLLPQMVTYFAAGFRSLDPSRRRLLHRVNAKPRLQRSRQPARG